MVWATNVIVFLELSGVVILTLTTSNVTCTRFPDCSESTISTQECCQVDRTFIRCSRRCPDGYYHSRDACGSTPGLSTADPAGKSFYSTSSTTPTNYNTSGSRVETAAAFTVSCCACHEACLECSAAGTSSCSSCARGYVFISDSESSGRCTTGATEAVDKVSEVTFLIGMSVGILVSAFLSLTTLLLFLRCRRKQLRRSDFSSNSGGITLSGPGSIPSTGSPRARSSETGSHASTTGQYALTNRARQDSVTSVGVMDTSTESGSVFEEREYFSRSRYEARAGMETSDFRFKFIVQNSSTTSHYSSFQSTRSVFSISSHKTVHSEYSFVYSKYSRDSRKSYTNTVGSYESTKSTQTELFEDGSHDRPYFSGTWQICKEFTSQGGTLRAPRSDVRVEIPEDAVEEDIYVLLKGAICTDLDSVHRNFQLPDSEYIMSPVAEYSAGRGFQFQKPVRVVLRHFLPPTFSKDNVKVYQCRLLESGDWTIQALHLEEKDNRRRLLTWKEYVQQTGVFYFAENSEIHVLTNHFSLYFCTDCGTNYPPPELWLEVHARHVIKEADERQVDVRLDIWDRRLQVQDFRQHLHDRHSENYRGMILIDTKTLPALAEKDLDSCHVKTSLELKAKNAESWMHTARGNDTLYPVESTLELRDFFPCTCQSARIPQRVDWQLTNRPGHTPGDSCGCYVDVGYVSRDGSYITMPRKVTIDVNVRKCSEEDINKPNDVYRDRSRGNQRFYNNLRAADDFSLETKPKQVLPQTAPRHPAYEHRWSDDSDGEQGAVGGTSSYYYPPTLARYPSSLSIGSCRDVYVYGSYASSLDCPDALTGTRVEPAESSHQRSICPRGSIPGSMAQAETDTRSCPLGLPVSSPTGRGPSRSQELMFRAPIPATEQHSEQPADDEY